jgi:hypothetical protein
MHRITNCTSVPFHFGKLSVWVNCATGDAMKNYSWLHNSPLRPHPPSPSPAERERYFITHPNGLLYHVNFCIIPNKKNSAI